VVERQLPKLNVASSSLVSRSGASVVRRLQTRGRTQVAKGAVCKTAIHQFDSGRPLFRAFHLTGSRIEMSHTHRHRL
jgi:hypothetical protein